MADLAASNAEGGEADFHDADGGDITPGEPVVVTPGKEDEVKVKRFNVKVLEFVTEAQRQHGLRHDDHERYRRYCARRIQRIRRALKFTNGKKTFKKRVMTADAVTDERHIHILIFETERAWAYYMQLKVESEEVERRRYHMFGRLGKAARKAAELRELLGEDGSLVDERTELEVAAYSVWMKALVFREKHKWADALVTFNNAKLIYERLSGVCSEMSKALYTKKKEDIDAQIRYCTFMRGDSEAGLEELLQGTGSQEMELLKHKLSTIMQDKQQADSENLSAITWRDQTCPIQSPVVQMHLLKIRSKETSLDQKLTTLSQDTEDTQGAASMNDSLMDAYDDVFGRYGDAVSAITDEITAEKKANKPTMDEALHSLNFTLDYLTHHRLERTITRTLAMVSDSAAVLETTGNIAKANDIVRFYDMILQNLSAMAEIETTADDESYSKWVAGRKLAYRSARCVYVARTHLRDKRFREAAALLDRVEELARLAQAEFNECNADVRESDIKGLRATQEKLRGDRCLLHAKSFMQRHATAGSPAAAAATTTAEGCAVTLFDRMGDYSIGKQVADGTMDLVQYPPDFQPVAAKPLFFDLAGGYIAFDVDTLKTRATPPVESSRIGAVGGAVTGALKGLFGGWGS